MLKNSTDQELIRITNEKTYLVATVVRGIERIDLDDIPDGAQIYDFVWDFIDICRTLPDDQAVYFIADAGELELIENEYGEVI